MAETYEATEATFVMLFVETQYSEFITRCELSTRYIQLLTRYIELRTRYVE